MLVTKGRAPGNVIVRDFIEEEVVRVGLLRWLRGFNPTARIGFAAGHEGELSFRTAGLSFRSCSGAPHGTLPA